MTKYACAFAGLNALNFACPADAAPVIYTLRTVTDGRIGGTVFTEAEVTFQFIGDTTNVEAHASASGAPIFINRKGETTVTIRQQGGRIVARVEAGQLYVRYDTGRGIAGFGSSFSATYPVALGCDGYYFDLGDAPGAPPPQPDCSTGEWVYGNYYGTFGGPNFLGGDFWDYGTLDALADMTAYPPDSTYYSEDTIAMLRSSLSRRGVLSGHAHVCAGSYQLSTAGINCPKAAPMAIETNMGPLYFQALRYQGEPSDGAMSIEIAEDD